jgi:hypothetical protein
MRLQDNYINFLLIPWKRVNIQAQHGSLRSGSKDDHILTTAHAQYMCSAARRICKSLWVGCWVQPTLFQNEVDVLGKI